MCAGYTVDCMYHCCSCRAEHPSEPVHPTGVNLWNMGPCSLNWSDYPQSGKHIVSGSYDNNTHVLDTLPYASVQSSSCNPIHPSFSAKPDKDGWVKDSEGGLLYWVPHGCHESMHSPAIMTIPLTSHNQSVSLDFDDFAFGTSWGQIFKSAPF